MASSVEWNGDVRIPSLQAAYRSGLSPVTVVTKLHERISHYKTTDRAVWIRLQTLNALVAEARALEAKYSDLDHLPSLFGIPFSIKDSIDIAGLPTTTGLSAFPPLSRTPTSSAPVYDSLIAAGALFVGKTNMDQLATGMTGCRSPYGIPHSVFSAHHIAGGSSSGSAVSVGAHLVSFSIGSDTAGSIRLPAAFNGVVGFKPTRGMISARGVTPACLSLDCVGVLAGNVDDARRVWEVVRGYDELDPYAKPPLIYGEHSTPLSSDDATVSFTFGIPPPDVSAFSTCSPIYLELFSATVQALQRAGGSCRELTAAEWHPFEAAGALLYEGTFVSERLASLPDNWLATNSRHLHPTIRVVFEAVVARQSTAVQAYRDLQAKATYTRQAEHVFRTVDVVMVPTAPTQWAIAEVLDDPVRKNSALGVFSHCANVLDLCAVAVPAGTYPVPHQGGDAGEGGRGVLPFGITLMSGSRMDEKLLDIARRYENVRKTIDETGANLPP
ncbi:hypothetical protein LTR04_004456 [Oleoguttula sp. CCFEE 6159]|nr:hypothetical protein LTR04_004456 [Oleoguttula sp. CCFEE 6159]